MTLCEKCGDDLHKDDKIVYSIEIRRQNGKYHGEYNNFVESNHL